MESINKMNAKAASSSCGSGQGRYSRNLIAARWQLLWVGFSLLAPSWSVAELPEVTSIKGLECPPVLVDSRGSHQLIWRKFLLHGDGFFEYIPETSCFTNRVFTEVWYSDEMAMACRYANTLKKVIVEIPKEYVMCKTRHWFGADGWKKTPGEVECFKAPRYVKYKDYQMNREYEDIECP